MPLGRLRTSNLVNPRRPLNKGRVAWWMAVPHLAGGPRWFDLLGRYHGVLAAGPAWRPTSRPGGWGEMAFAGAGQVVAVATPTRPVTAFSAFAWIFNTASSAAFRVAVGGTNWYIASGAGAANQFNLYFATSAGSVNPTPTGLAARVWQRVGITWDGVTVTWWLDGAVLTSSALSGTFTRDVTGISNASFPWVGSLDDLSAWDRSLAGSARADRDLSRQGYPGPLNRWRPTATLLAAAAPADPFPAGHYQPINTLIRL